MQIPKQTFKSRPVFHKKCLEPGCSKMFDGIGVAKYCKKHRNPKNRYKKKIIISDHSKNIYLKHNFTDEQNVERSCLVCGSIYSFKLEPKQFLYPGCCPKCRHQKGDVDGSGNEIIRDPGVGDSDSGIQIGAGADSPGTDTKQETRIRRKHNRKRTGGRRKRRWSVCRKKHRRNRNVKRTRGPGRPRIHPAGTKGVRTVGVHSKVQYTKLKRHRRHRGARVLQKPGKRKSRNPRKQVRTHLTKRRGYKLRDYKRRTRHSPRRGRKAKVSRR